MGRETHDVVNSLQLAARSKGLVPVLLYVLLARAPLHTDTKHLVVSTFLHSLPEDIIISTHLHSLVSPALDVSVSAVSACNETFSGLMSCFCLRVAH